MRVNSASHGQRALLSPIEIPRYQSPRNIFKIFIAYCSRNSLDSITFFVYGGLLTMRIIELGIQEAKYFDLQNSPYKNCNRPI